MRIPSIDLIDAKKIIGGSYLDDTHIDGYEDIEKITVTDDPCPHGGGDYRDGDYDYDDDHDYDHDYDQNEQEEREPDESPNEKSRPIVENGHCAIGSMASMVQAKTGCSTEEAIAKVMAAAKALGVSTEIIKDEEGNPSGIAISPSQVESRRNVALMPARSVKAKRER